MNRNLKFKILVLFFYPGAKILFSGACEQHKQQPHHILIQGIDQQPLFASTADPLLYYIALL